MRREIPLLITFITGMFMIISLFVPHPLIAKGSSSLQNWLIIVSGFAVVLGVGNIIRVNGRKISRREEDWGFKVILLIALFGMFLTGLIGKVDEGTIFDWLYMNMEFPMEATMFSLLAFFIASAAYRAFRMRSVEAGLLLVAAVIVMLGRVSLGEILTSSLPKPLQLPILTEWIMGFPNMAAKRGIMIGAAMGAMAMSLRIILGIERSYLGGGK